MKIRTDFVTNSSSSSFIACGVWSEELAEFVTQLLGGKNRSYDRYKVGVLTVSDHIVSVTTTLDFGHFHINNGYGERDHRTDKQQEMDDQNGATPDSILDALFPFLPSLTPEQEAELTRLLCDAFEEGHTAAEVYIDQTDDFEPREFSAWDFGEEEDYTARSRDVMAQSWLRMYGDTITQNPLVYFPDSVFVFTGFSFGDDGRSAPLAKAVVERGGIFRGSVSGNTHYLVVNPAGAGESKIRKVRELRGKGVYIDVILAGDLERILKEERTAEQEETIRTSVLARRKAEEDARRAKKLEEGRRLRKERAREEMIRRQQRWKERDQQAAEQERQRREEEAQQEETIVAALQQLKDRCAASGTKFESMEAVVEALSDKTVTYAVLNRCIRHRFALDAKTFLTQNQILASNVDRWSAEIEETVQLLAQRYAAAQKKAASVREVARENPDVNMTSLIEKASLCTGKTALALLVERGIVYSNSELLAIEAANITAQPRDPAEIPPNIQRRMDTLFAKLNEAYPDRVIVRLNADHKKWAETVTELYRALGYDSPKEFLTAYGYRYDTTDKGGRPTKNPMEIIEELQRRYPNGADFATVNELKAANPDLAPRFQNLQNRSNEFFGMSFSKYLRSIGLIK